MSPKALSYLALKLKPFSLTKTKYLHLKYSFIKTLQCCFLLCSTNCIPYSQHVFAQVNVHTADILPSGYFRKKLSYLQAKLNIKLATNSLSLFSALHYNGQVVLLLSAGFLCVYRCVSDLRMVSSCSPKNSLLLFRFLMYPLYSTFPHPKSLFQFTWNIPKCLTSPSRAAWPQVISACS